MYMVICKTKVSKGLCKESSGCSLINLATSLQKEYIRTLLYRGLFEIVIVHVFV